MSLRKLPAIDPQAFDGLHDLSWPLREDAFSRWDGAVHSAKTDNNTISILEVIGKDWDGSGVDAKRVAGALRQIGNRDVVVEINSPGGSFFDGVAIYNMLREHPAKVTVNVLGLAASAASVIAMAGDDVRIAKSGFFMIHNAWGVCVGNRHDMVQVADELKKFDESMQEVYADTTDMSQENAAKYMDAETWFSGKDAVAIGLADSFLPSDAITENASASAQSDEIRARIQIENALMMQGKSRKERRALLSRFKGGTPSASAPVTPRADDWMGGIRSLIDTIRS